jgi:hypothetical protein
LSVFEKGMPGRMCEPNIEEVRGEWKELYNLGEGLRKLFFSLNIIEVIKSRGVRCSGLVVLTE